VRRRLQGEAAEGEEEDTTSDLLLKHPSIIITTYKIRLMKYLKHVSETLAKTCKKHLKPIANIRNIQIKHLQHMCEIYTTSR